MPDESQSEPEVDEATLQEAKESVAGLDERYRPGGRPTVSLPGTNGTVAGTAFADMVDDNGDLKDGEQDDASSTTEDSSSTDQKVASTNDG